MNFGLFLFILIFRVRVDYKSSIYNYRLRILFCFLNYTVKKKTDMRLLLNSNNSSYKI